MIGSKSRKIKRKFAVGEITYYELEHPDMLLFVSKERLKNKLAHNEWVLVETEQEADNETEPT